MAANKKSKMLYVMKILVEQTDENNTVTLNEILRQLEDIYGIKAERKSIYDDIDTLIDFGIDIEKRRTKTMEYYIANRDFQLPELKLLVDAVQSAKFITAKKSNELINKLERLCSESQAKSLRREVIVSDRVKTLNESIYYNTDIIHTAIIEDKKVKFLYYDLEIGTGSDKIKKVYRKNGDFYVVSPWALHWDDENYYLIAFDSEAEKIKHYRVDKMTKIDLLGDKRDGKNEMRDFNPAQYGKKTFSMYGGEEKDICLEFKNNLLGVVVDRFGSNIYIAKANEDSFRINVNVAVSPTFYSWLFNFGTDVKIISPKSVANEFREKAKAVSKYYKENKNKK